jgi:hypothetical protein
MTNTKLLQKIITIDEDIINKIIKPKQLSVLKKQISGQKLTENEKRYLRGNLRNKLEFLEQFQDTLNGGSEHQQLLNIIDTYYITGLEALKYHGFGWYYKTKMIEIIDTRLEGKIRLNKVTLKFYRVRSINYSDFIIDEQTGLKYATNEQIIKDIKYTKNQYTEFVWRNMLNRYRKQFVDEPAKYPKYLDIEEVVDYSKFGV